MLSLQFRALDFVVIAPNQGRLPNARANVVSGAVGAVASFRLSGRPFWREA